MDYGTLFYFIAMLVLIVGDIRSNKSSNAGKMAEALKYASFGESAIRYSSNTNWLDFKKQVRKIQGYYISYLNEIAECLSSLSSYGIKRIKESDFKGTEVILIKLVQDGKEYLMELKYLYPNTGYLKVSIGDETEYYYLEPESNRALLKIILESDRSPFEHINLTDYKLLEILHGKETNGQHR
ncbi:MAG: hypothetical protein IKF68_04005 [Erysipelotrichaceae bacterium]|nr:hypothetical protein [Erysipelotrichaceae bacterium]